MILCHHWLPIDMLQLLHSASSIPIPLLSSLTSSSNNRSQVSFFFSLIPSFLVFSVFCLFVEELHKGDMLYNVIGIINENEFLLAVVQNLLITPSRCVDNKKL